MTCSPCLRRLNDFEISLLLSAIAAFIILTLEAIFFLAPMVVGWNMTIPVEPIYYDIDDEYMNVQSRSHYAFSVVFIKHQMYRRIKDESEDEFICSGNLIDEDFVLTSGICSLNIVEAQISNILVRTGNIENRQYSVIEKIIQHPQFDADSLSNDLSLIKVKTKFDVNAPSVSTIRLVNVSSPDITGHMKKLLLITWDSDEWHFTDIIDQTVRWLSAVMVERYVCMYNMRSSNINITMQHLCANIELPEGMCEISIGSGLIRPRHEALVAITSKVWSCRETKPKPSIFTSVVPYINWINDTVVGS